MSRTSNTGNKKDRHVKMTKIDVAIRNNGNVLNGDIASNGTSEPIDDADRAHTASCLLLEFLPRDLLAQSILGTFLDGDSLANFWCATMSKQDLLFCSRDKPKKCLSSSSSSMMVDIIRIMQRRRALLTEEEYCDNSGDNSRYGSRRMVFRAFEEAMPSKTIPCPLGADAMHTKSTKRTDEKTKDSKFVEDQSKTKALFNFDGFLSFSRKIFSNLWAMDYCERVPHNLIWCGFLRMQTPTIASGNDSPPIKVALLVHPQRWSMKEIRLWRNATTRLSLVNAGEKQSQSLGKSSQPPTVKAKVIPHNFMPVGPTRGRLVGIAQSDRESLREIAEELNRSDLVGRFSCTTTSAGSGDDTNGGQFTVKLMGFEGAQHRLGSVFRRGYEPGGMLLREEKEKMIFSHRGGGKDNLIGADHDRNSLLCCWSHEFLWEESKSFRMETSYALRDTMKEYSKLIMQCK